LRVSLGAKGLKEKVIHKEIFFVCGGKCLSHKAVHNWVEKLSQRLPKLADDARPGVQQVEDLISVLRVSAHW
jgi:hypothetical protein